jgi:hypothetical protein
MPGDKLKYKAAMRRVPEGKNRYKHWNDIISAEDRECIDRSLHARKSLLKGGFDNMADKIEKMLKQEFPGLPREAFKI